MDPKEKEKNLRNENDTIESRNIIIDYYTCACALTPREEKISSAHTVVELAGHHILTRKGGEEVARAVVPQSELWTPARAFAPGAVGYRNEEDGRRLAYQQRPNNLMIYDLPGKACARIGQHKQLSTFLLYTSGDATRIDIALDLKTNMRPKAFLRYLDLNERITRTSIRSGTGETEYIGSQKSERYARVYRYFEPHPRSDTLRIELVYRRNYAKKVAEIAATGNLAAIVSEALGRYGCSHPGLELDDVGAASLQVPRRHAKSNAGTLIWLKNAVAPAIARIMSEGELSWEELTEWINDEMGKKSY